MNNILWLMFGIFSAIIVFIAIELSPTETDRESVSSMEARVDQIESRLVDQAQFSAAIYALCVDANIKSVTCSQARANFEKSK